MQSDIWVHQHPSNCSDPSVRFLIADWEKIPGFGIGAQLAGMCGLLAIAINENRVLVTNYYNRADHDGCKGKSVNFNVLKLPFQCFFCSIYFVIFVKIKIQCVTWTTCSHLFKKVYPYPFIF